MSAATSADRLPQFIIVGAVKAATTWSARRLAEAPSTFLPGPEPHFFSEEFARGIGWYAEFFRDAPDGAVIGEKSADYLAHPEAAGRIARLIPDARLIVQLRNPVDRAYSDYCMLYRRGTVREEPGAYFSAAGGYGARFLGGGLYAEHIARFYSRFAAKQILVVLHDDIADAPDHALERLCSHVGVRPPPLEGDAARRENDGAAPLLPLPMRRALRPFKKSVAAFRGQAWFEGLRGLAARPVKYPPLSDDTRARLADYYRADVAALARLIGRDLSHWLGDGRARHDERSTLAGQVGS